MTLPPAWTVWVTNGSIENAASNDPFSSPGAISGNGTSTSSIDSGSTPCFSSEALTTTSATLLSVLTAIFLPSRSLTSFTSESLPTTSAPKSFEPSGCATVPGAITWIGRSLDAPSSSETTLEPPTWMSPLTSAGIVAAPPCVGDSSMSSFCLSNMPFSIPKATNAEGTPAVSCTLSLVVPPSPVAGADPSSPHPAARRVSATSPATSLIRPTTS